jgi:formamidopyrimidine-DNA glycosylase
VTLHRALSVSDRSVKALLLDQRLVAGVGNIYADEALWLAGVHPARAGRSLSPTEVEVLLARLVEVCEASIAAGGTTFRDYRDVSGTSGGFAARLSVYGRAGQPCRRCGLPLVSGRVAGRGTVWCRSCQPEEGDGSGTDTVSDPLRTTEVAR